MTGQDFLSAIKTQVREELNREANEAIEKLVHKFRCELGKHKTPLIADILRKIEVLSKEDELGGNVTIQINIIADRGGDDA